MNVIPVLDILGGQVVHAIAGDRRSYRPLASPLLSGPTTPAGLAELFVRDWGLNQIYLADLDAIGGEPPRWDLYAELLDLGVRLWIDAGVRAADDARRFVTFRSAGGRAFERVILGLESVTTESLLSEFVSAVGVERAVFSLDMDDGRLRTSLLDWRDASPRELVVAIHRAGFRQVVLLDLRRVGTATGTGTAELVRQMSDEFPEIDWVAGGGVRGPQDLTMLRIAGCRAVLVASAFHRGQLSRKDLCG